jgi:hypothetical protein
MYIDPELMTDETSVAEAILAGTADRIDSALDLTADEGWEPAEGSPETSMAEAVGIIAATALSMVLDQERREFAAFGEIVLGMEREHAEPAIGYSRWDFSPPGTYEIPDGSEMTLVAPNGQPVAYATVGDVTATGASATDVQVVALEPGSVANGLLGDAIDWEAIPFVVGVEMTTAPTGGTDEQTPEDYLDKVTRRARRMKTVPIVTDDYADAALDHPSVAAALAVRHLNNEAYPGPPASEGYVKLFLRGPTGLGVPSGVKAEVIEMMAGADRPLGVTVTVGDPELVSINITVSVRLKIGTDEAAAVEAVQAAITNAYNPAGYAFDPSYPGNWKPPTTFVDRLITQFDVAALIDDLEGVDKVTDVSINGDTDVSLTGWAPLPVMNVDPVVLVVS